MNDQDLKDNIARNEHRALLSALAVVSGLALEVIFAAAFHEPPETLVSHWGPVVSDTLVALGVAGEVLFSHKARNNSEELTRRSEERLSDALARASRTEQELIHLKTPRRILFDARASNALIVALTPYSGTVFDIGMGPNDGEVEDFAWDLGPQLWAAGWNQIDWIYPGGIVSGYRFGGAGMSRPAMGQVAASNVLVQLDPSASSQLHSAAKAFIDSLNQTGIEAHIVDFNVHNMNANTMHVLIGPKR
jgi:hypothetical protein